MKIPDFVDDIPVLLESDLFYYDAFDSLNTERIFTGFGIGRIPWRSIIYYAERLKMGFHETEYFKNVIEIIDSNYVSFSNKK